MAITIDLLRRRVGDTVDGCVLCTDENEPKELAGVYRAEEVLMLDGVEKTVAERKGLAVTGERCPESLEDGCDAGGEDCGGVPKVVPVGSLSKTDSRSWLLEMEKGRSMASSRFNRVMWDGRLE